MVEGDEVAPFPGSYRRMIIAAGSSI